MENFYREKAFHTEKNIRKNDFAPQKIFPVMPLEVCAHLKISSQLGLYTNSKKGVNID